MQKNIDICEKCGEKINKKSALNKKLDQSINQCTRCQVKILLEIFYPKIAA